MKEHPKKVLFYCKPFDASIITDFVEIYTFIQENFNHIQVFVDEWVIKEIKENTELKMPKIWPTVFVNKGDEERRQIEFIITLGGDGTILWASK